jgi:hypothetical protein
MKKWMYALAGLLMVLGLLRLFTFSSPPQTGKTPLFSDHYHIHSLNIPEKLEFAGEKVPLHDYDVIERIDRELLVNTYWQSQMLLFNKRAARWFPVIEPILKQYRVPDDFKYLALAESGLTHAVSPSGAVGFWQFIEESGKKYGLKINEEVDERYHVEKSTEAACRYLLDAYSQFNNWTLAAASYNMGIPGIKKQLERQKVNSYYDLMLNDETFRYVFRAIAIKTIMSDLPAYGFHIRKKDLYRPLKYTTVTVDSAVTDFADFAFQQSINYKMLKLLNPWLRQSYLLNKTKKQYAIKILNPDQQSHSLLEEEGYAETSADSTR